MTVESLYRTVSQSLIKQSQSPALDARLLIEHVLKLDDTGFILKAKEELSDLQVNLILKLAKEREAGVPVAYLTNKRDFFGRTFYVQKEVLIPQPDTETLVEEALKSFDSEQVSILDLCAGTGCIGITLAAELCNKATVELTLSDISKTAYETFSINCESLLDLRRVKLCKCLGDMFDTVRGKKFDLIVSNPPYIRKDVIPTLPLEVLSEPHLALDGGDDGLDFVRILAEEAQDYLNGNGTLIVEIGFDQGESARACFEGCGWKNVQVIKDLGGCDRVVKCNK